MLAGFRIVSTVIPAFFLSPDPWYMFVIHDFPAAGYSLVEHHISRIDSPQLSHTNKKLEQFGATAASDSQDEVDTM
jgi:hypothetical protein